MMVACLRSARKLSRYVTFGASLRDNNIRDMVNHEAIQKKRKRNAFIEVLRVVGLVE